jgi:hypothetical protein
MSICICVRKHYLISFLKINADQLKLIVSYIVSAVPYEIYLDKYFSFKSYLQVNMIHEVITFLLGEKIDSQYFGHHLDDIKNRVLLGLMQKSSIVN